MKSFASSRILLFFDIEPYPTGYIDYRDLTSSLHSDTCISHNNIWELAFRGI